MIRLSPTVMTMIIVRMKMVPKEKRTSIKVTTTKRSHVRFELQSLRRQ